MSWPPGDDHECRSRCGEYHVTLALESELLQADPGQLAGARAALAGIMAAFAAPIDHTLWVHGMEEGSHVARLDWADPLLLPFYHRFMLLRRRFGNHVCWDLTVSI